MIYNCIKIKKNLNVPKLQRVLFLLTARLLSVVPPPSGLLSIVVNMEILEGTHVPCYNTSLGSV